MQQFVPLCVVKDTEIMSASTLNTRWKEGATGQSLPVFSSSQDLFTRIGVKPQERRCPSCDSIVYTRRHSRCGVCEQLLPESVIFSGADADRVSALLKSERQRHKAWLMRIESSGSKV